MYGHNSSHSASRARASINSGGSTYGTGSTAGEGIERHLRFGGLAFGEGSLNFSTVKGRPAMLFALGKLRTNYLQRIADVLKTEASMKPRRKAGVRSRKIKKPSAQEPSPLYAPIVPCCSDAISHPSRGEQFRLGRSTRHDEGCAG